MGTRPRHRVAVGAASISVLLALTWLGTAASGNAPASRSVDAAAGRDFTISGPSGERGDEVLNADATPAQATRPVEELTNRTTAGEAPAPNSDDEASFDAMIAEFEKAFPGLLTFGGAAPAAPDADGMRWLIMSAEPTPEQVRLLQMYSRPLHLYYGKAPTPDSMRDFANALRTALMEHPSIRFEGYGFNADHTGLQVLFTAASDLTVEQLQQLTNPVVADVDRSLGEPRGFSLDFIENVDPPVAQADIKGGYGLTISGDRECTSGFTAVATTTSESSRRGTAPMACSTGESPEH